MLESKINFNFKKKKLKISFIPVFYAPQKPTRQVEYKEIENIFRVIKTWRKYPPSVCGKIILADTLLLSQFFPCLTFFCSQCRNTIIYQFLWKRKYNNKSAIEKVKKSNVVKLTSQQKLTRKNNHDEFVS